MSSEKATVKLVPTLSADTYAIEAGEGVSLRLLERTLASAGLSDVISRGPGRIYFPRRRLASVLQMLESGWKYTLASEISAGIVEVESTEAKLARAREIVRWLSNPAAANQTLSSLEGVDVLDDHQRIAVAIGSHTDVFGFCLFDEQGLGKTVTALYIFHRLRLLGLVSRMLVVSPKNMLLEWVNDLERFLGSHYSCAAVVGSQAEKRTVLDGKHDVLSVNFETVVSMEIRLKDLLIAERGRFFLVVDESFFVKNRDAQRTRALRRLREHVERCLVLCGTPAPNSPVDIVEQFNLADGGITFRDAEIPDDRASARPVVQEILQTRGVYIRRLKAEVLTELPSKTFNKVFVPMQPIQKQAYSAALNCLISELSASDDISFSKNITSFLARRTALLQICSCPSSIINDYHETPSKLVALDLILEDLVEKRCEKVVIWSFYTSGIDALMRRYAIYNPVRFDGTITRAEERREAVRRFQSDDTTMLFVANPAAAGAGLTLHRARFAIYESMSNQAAHYLQSLDRIHRRGQDRPVEYIVLLCERSLEVLEYELLRNKEIAAQGLLGDTVSPAVTREIMLAEALDAAKMLNI